MRVPFIWNSVNLESVQIELSDPQHKNPLNCFNQPIFLTYPLLMFFIGLQDEAAFFLLAEKLFGVYQ